MLTLFIKLCDDFNFYSCVVPVSFQNSVNGRKGLPTSGTEHLRWFSVTFQDLFPGSPSATLSRHQDMPRSTVAQQLRRSKLQCCRPARVEQFTATTARHELCAFQASTENISIRELVNHGALSLFAVLRLRNTLTYLLTFVVCFPLNFLDFVRRI